MALNIGKIRNRLWFWFDDNGAPMLCLVCAFVVGWFVVGAMGGEKGTHQISCRTESGELIERTMQGNLEISHRYSGGAIYAGAESFHFTGICTVTTINTGK